MRLLRQLSSAELLKILNGHGATQLKKRGKGSHVMVERSTKDGVRKTTVPTSKGTVALGTINSIRRQLRLTPEDGCSDQGFYGA